MDSQNTRGFVEVVVGPMYSGKTEELVRRMVRRVYGKQNVLLCTKDTRYGHGVTVSHAGRKMESCYVEKAEDILALDLSNVSVIGIDEGQFFGPRLMEVCLELSYRGKIVYVAALDMDYLEKPFENVAYLMAVAESVTKLAAVCVLCGKDATRSHRKIRSTERVLEGDSESYEALCRPCYLESSSDGKVSRVAGPTG